MLFQGCAPCHSECSRCHGPGSESCDDNCRHFSQESRCVPECSAGYYSTNYNASITTSSRNHDDTNHNMTSGMCLPCYSHCFSCTGPLPSDCIVCKMFFIYDEFENRHSKDATVGFRSFLLLDHSLLIVPIVKLISIVSVLSRSVPASRGFHAFTCLFNRLSTNLWFATIKFCWYFNASEVKYLVFWCVAIYVSLYLLSLWVFEMLSI